MQTTPYRALTRPQLIFSLVLLGISWFLLALVGNFLTAWFLPASLFPASVPTTSLNWLRDSLPRLVVGLSLYWLLVPALLGVKCKNYGGFLRIAGVTRFRPGGWRLFLLFIALSLALSWFYVSRYGDALSNLSDLTTWWKWLADIQPPLVEEMLYRGILLSLLVKYTKPWVAIVVSSLLFGLLHLVVWGTLGALFSATFIAVLLALGWFMTGSLWPGVLAHFTMNQGLFLPISFAYLLVLAVAPLFRHRLLTVPSSSSG